MISAEHAPAAAASYRAHRIGARLSLRIKFGFQDARLRACFGVLCPRHHAMIEFLPIRRLHRHRVEGEKMLRARPRAHRKNERADAEHQPPR